MLGGAIRRWVGREVGTGWKEEIVAGGRYETMAREKSGYRLEVGKGMEGVPPVAKSREICKPLSRAMKR